MRRALALSAIAVLAAVAVTTAAVGTAARPAATAAGKPLVIGVATAQTGFLSAFDAPAVSGALIAVDDINKAGGVLGRQLRVVRADTKSNINLGAQAGLSVLSKGADVMLVTLDFNYGGPAAREAQKAGVVAISIGASSPKFGPSRTRLARTVMSRRTPNRSGRIRRRNGTPPTCFSTTRPTRTAHNATRSRRASRNSGAPSSDATRSRTPTRQSLRRSRASKACRRRPTRSCCARTHRVGR
jgi:hypothetical protein